MGVLAKPGAASSASTIGWQLEHMGAGGFTVGGDTHPDGTRVTRVDTNGGYLWISASSPVYGTHGYWKQLATIISMPTRPVPMDEFIGAYGAGFYELRIDPSNSNKLVGLIYGCMCYSLDKGNSWTFCPTGVGGWSQCDFIGGTTRPAAHNNFQSRGQGQKGAINPGDTNHWIFSCWGRIKQTFDGGTTWLDLTGGSGVTAPTNWDCAVMFLDTNNILINSRGVGIYLSTNKGTTWTLVSGTTGMMVFNWSKAIDGVVYAVTGTAINSSGNSIYKYASGAWALVKSVAGYYGIACHPSSAGTIYFGLDNSTMARSTDFGVTIASTGQRNIIQGPEEPPWLSAGANTGGAGNPGYLSLFNIVWDYITGGLINCSGVGAMISAPLWAGTGAAIWETMCRGNESLITVGILALESGKRIYTCQDRWIFDRVDPTAWPDDYHPESATSYTSGTRIGNSVGAPIPCSNNTSFVAAHTLTYGPVYSGDGGVTWTQAGPFPPAIDEINGSLAISTPDNWVYIDAAIAGGVWYTTNARAATPTWVAATGTFSFDDKTRTVCADAGVPGKFYLHTGLKIMISTDNGATWVNGYVTNMGSGAGGHALRSIPGKTGCLLFSASGTGNLQKSLNGGVTFAAVPGVIAATGGSNVSYLTVGFGKAKPAGGGYPAVFIGAKVSGVTGFYRSDDIEQATPTWEYYGTWPADMCGGGQSGWTGVCGDFNNYGDMFVQQHGVAWYNYA